MIGQNVQLIDIFRRVFVQHRGTEQTKAIIKAKGPQAQCIIVP
jgi:hypothetical protein